MIFPQLPRHSHAGECPSFANRPAAYAGPASRTLILRTWYLERLRCPVCRNPMHVVAKRRPPRAKTAQRTTNITG